VNVEPVLGWILAESGRISYAGMRPNVKVRKRLKRDAERMELL
jgi:hypothetical protein